MMRLDKYLAERTGMTRSESRKAITKGRVMVAGKICRKADTQLDETAAQIALDGAPLAGEYKKYVYIMLNKPEGVVSASRDKRDTTVVDLVAADYPRRELFPAGRLDKTSTGFVLLTDDGALAHDILAPAHHVDKQYLVTLDTPLTEEMRRGFAAGVTLADGEHLAPAEAERPGTTPAPCASPCTRASTTRSSACSASTTPASTPSTVSPSAALHWMRPLPPASTGN